MIAYTRLHHLEAGSGAQHARTYTKRRCLLWPSRAGSGPRRAGALCPRGRADRTRL